MKLSALIKSLQATLDKDGNLNITEMWVSDNEAHPHLILSGYMPDGGPGDLEVKLDGLLGDGTAR